MFMVGSEAFYCSHGRVCASMHVFFLHKTRYAFVSHRTSSFTSYPLSILSFPAATAAVNRSCDLPLCDASLAKAADNSCNADTTTILSYVLQVGSVVSVICHALCQAWNIEFSSCKSVFIYNRLSVIFVLLCYRTF